MQFPNSFFSLLVALQIQVAQNGAILFYNGNPGHGNLVGSIAPVAGTDPYGNPYPQGISFTFGGVSWLVSSELFGGSNVPIERFSTGLATEFDSYHVGYTTTGVAGTSRLYQVEIVGPADTTNKDVCAVFLFSGNDGGTQNAQGWLLYDSNLSGGGITQAQVQWGSSGVFLGPVGSITATKPGTGGSVSNVAQFESWHNLTMNAGYQSAPGLVAPRFQYEMMNGNRVRLNGAVQLTANKVGGSIIGNLSTSFGAGGSAYIPTNQQSFNCPNNLSGQVGLSTTIHIDTSGNLVHEPAGSTNNVIIFDDVIYVLD